MNRHTYPIKNKNYPNAYILLCAGKNRSRKYSKQNNSLLEFDNKSCIEHQIETIRKVEKNPEIIVVGGFDAKKLLNHVSLQNVRFVENPAFESTTSLESFRIGINSSVLCNLFVIHGDVLFNENAIKTKGNKPLVMLNKSVQSSKNVCVAYNGSVVKNLSYGLDIDENVSEWAEMFFIPSDHYQLTKSIANEFKKYHTIYEFINYLNQDVNFLTHWDKKMKIEKIYEKVEL